MARSNDREKTRLIVAIVLLSGFGLLILALAISGRLAPLVHQMWDIFRNRDHMRMYVESWGALAPAAFIAIQAFQVVLAPIPGEFTGVVGGFIFGGVPNLVYSTIGLSIGSVVNFLAARIIGLPLVKLVVSNESMERFHFLTQSRGVLLALVLFAIPGFPKDILSYILGLSPMGFVTFVVVCTLGRIPGTVMLSFSGSAVYEQNWTLLLVICIVCAMAFAPFFIWRAKIECWLKGRSGDTSP